MIWLVYQIFKVIITLVLPFICLIRGSLYLSESMGYPPVLSILGGTLMTMFVLFIYLTIFYGRVTGRIGGDGVIKRRLTIVFLFVAGFAIHGLFFISDKNLKETALKQEMMQLHPILRLSLSTLIHIDNDLIVTDAARTKADYERMGLSPKEKSSHYIQESGYVHAVDLRVKGRSEIRNILLKVYFSMMGFDTLRHKGTADHLHVAMD